ncbi:MAG: F0F1 ATP synthase subunit A [Chloroflexota bacterium]
METVALDATDARPPRRRVHPVVWLILAVVLLDAIAFLVVPPFPKGGAPGDPCAFPVCFINGNLEFPPPHVIWDLDPSNPMPGGSLVIAFHPSITSTLLTMWIVELVLLIVGFAATRRPRSVPGRLQNFVEWAYESLDGFARSTGGPEAARHVPIFATFFIFILFSNWSGLVSPVGKVEELRAPTSDVNVTIGLALVAFVYIEAQGFRRLGLGYLAKFFPLREFRSGIGAGLIGMFVGIIELMLELVKPVTLSMRLFGNIYGGEVALGVVTALTVAILPVMIVGLEAMLNFVQALIFSTLTLMFTLVAMESHHEEKHAVHDATLLVEESTGPEHLVTSPAH